MAALGTHTLTSVNPAFIRRIRYVFTRSAPVLAMPCILNKKIDVALIQFPSGATLTVAFPLLQREQVPYRVTHTHGRPLTNLVPFSYLIEG